MTTMALPYGVQPRDGALAHTGTFAGTSYDFRAVLLVGAHPARSPYARGFDPEALPGSAPGDTPMSRRAPRVLATQAVQRAGAALRQRRRPDPRQLLHVGSRPARPPIPARAQPY